LHAMSDRHESPGATHQRPGRPRGWLERCCSSRCTSLRFQTDPKHWRLDDEELPARKYRALFPSPSADREAGDDVARVVEQCGVPLLAFSSGDLLEETSTVPAAHVQRWAIGTVRAKVGSCDDRGGQSTGEKHGRSRPDDEAAPSVGLFPLEYTAPVLAEPRLHRAIHRFKQSAAAEDRGELWFLEGDSILVTAMLPSTEDASGRATNSWAYGHVVRGAREGAAGLVPLAYLALPTRQGAMDALPSPSRSPSPVHNFAE
jgi:hypothetical protein